MKTLSCHNLCYSRRLSDGGARRILENIDHRFSAGEIAVISGAVGAGKSTFIHLLAGLMRPEIGEVQADGEPVSRWVSAHRDIWRRKVGIVFQHAPLMTGITAFENVILPLVPRRITLAEIRAAGIRVLESLEAEHLAGKAVHSLSGGERQKIAIARALCGKPELILADEPTAHQDNQAARRILELLRHRADAGSIVILTAHDPRITGSAMGDRNFIIEGTRLRAVT